LTPLPFKGLNYRPKLLVFLFSDSARLLPHKSKACEAAIEHTLSSYINYMYKTWYSALWHGCV